MLIIPFPFNPIFLKKTTIIYSLICNKKKQLEYKKGQRTNVETEKIAYRYSLNKEERWREGEVERRREGQEERRRGGEKQRREGEEETRIEEERKREGEEERYVDFAIF